MTEQRLRFLSRNANKIQEVESILGGFGIEVVALEAEIHEIQTPDAEHLVRDKTLKAFQICGRPLFVEHTGLSLEALNGFPGGLTQVFWDTVQADRFAELFGRAESSKVIARTDIGYTDGRQVFLFSGEVLGSIPAAPRGDRTFQWDCVFVPDGHEQTFAEMGSDAKKRISMRRQALERLAEHLGGRR